jgi:hypothetical protein
MKKNNLIIGETCLLKYQLGRLGLERDATNIFDDMLVNLDGVRGIISEDFKDLLSTEHLKTLNYLHYPDEGIYHRKPLNTKYTVNDDNLYSWDVCSFFHFDVQSQEGLSSLNRKLERTKNLFESSEPISLYYYYRHHSNCDIPRLRSKMLDFHTFVTEKYKKDFRITLITQEQGDADGLDIVEDTSKLYHGHFTTVNSWVGTDDNWDAHLSNDLFDVFLSK